MPRALANGGVLTPPLHAKRVAAGAAKSAAIAARTTLDDPTTSAVWIRRATENVKLAGREEVRFPIVVRAAPTGGIRARDCGVLAWRPYLAPLLLTGVAAESRDPVREAAGHLHVTGVASNATETRRSHDGWGPTRLRPLPGARLGRVFYRLKDLKCIGQPPEGSGEDACVEAFAGHLTVALGFGTTTGINGYPAEHSRSENVNERRVFVVGTHVEGIPAVPREPSIRSARHKVSST